MCLHKVDGYRFFQFVREKVLHKADGLRFFLFVREKVPP